MDSFLKTGEQYMGNSRYLKVANGKFARNWQKIYYFLIIFAKLSESVRFICFDIYEKIYCCFGLLFDNIGFVG